MKQTYENNKRRIQAFKITANVNDDNGVIHHFVDGYEYVEIGGLKWATCNVGAEKETDGGLYFAWGETKGYTADQVGNKCGQKRFTWEDYKFGRYANFSKYSENDGLDTLEACDDAATQNMGENWRMPTKEEFDALLSSTISEWVTDYQSSGVNGRLFTDKIDKAKKLFFPAVGYCGYGSVYYVGSYGGYWSSSFNTWNDIVGCGLFFGNKDRHMSGDYRRNGFPIRGVIK